MSTTRLHQQPRGGPYDKRPPETMQAIRQLSSGKAPGSDAILAEICKHDSLRLMEKLATLFQMWLRRQIPEDFMYATIFRLYKQKGNRQLYDKQGTISLLTITEISSRILLKRPKDHLEQRLLRKVSVDSEAELLHDFRHPTTAKEMQLTAILMDAYRDESPWIRITCRTDGHLLNSWRMQASTYLSKTFVHDLRFADGCALSSVSEDDMQRSMETFPSICAKFEPTINIGKTVVMHQPPLNATYSVLRTHVNGIKVKTVDNFVYLGSTLTLHQNRRRDGSPDLQSQQGLRPVAEPRVESPRFSP
ncbi:hypothetical protein SprV_0100182300 [Sparganum proliferum]